MKLGGGNFQRRLLKWYRRERRDLPWRRTRDPYRIWVSEIMLQQTQVSTVVPYYQRFVKELPTVRRLAAAPFSKVLSLWAGLGYYHRSRNLHRTAGLIVRNHRGRFPDRHEDVLALPGIGRYTAGAILSLAFNKRFPVVDGNVERVLARVLALRGNIKSAPHQKRLWAVAEQLVPASAPSDFNQAMMELGATVCLPRQPQCGRCPVLQSCAAHRLHLEMRIPQVRRSMRVQEAHRLAAVVRDSQNRILLAQRREETLMRDFWEFPLFDVPPEKKKRAQGKAEPPRFLERALQKRFGGSFHVETSLCSFVHSITFRRIHLRAYSVKGCGDGQRLSQLSVPTRWVPFHLLKKYLFDSASLKILAALTNDR